MRSMLPTMLILAATGCAGGHGWVKAPTAQYPVSLSSAIRAADGHLLDKTERRTVGHFDASKTFVAMFYDAIPLNGSFDLSDDINEQVRAANGEAITELTFHVRLCPLDVFPVFHILPFWPGCSTVRVTGNIIRSINPTPQ